MTKMVSIKSAPSTCDADGGIRSTVTSLDNIVANIDTACGRNGALRAYIFALRDLQCAHNDACFADGVDRIDERLAAVAAAFDALIVAEFRDGGAT